MTGDGTMSGIDHQSATPAAQSLPTRSRPSLTADQVIEALTYIPQGTSPRAAIEAALAMREELLPRLAGVLALTPAEIGERYEASPDNAFYFLHEIAMHLLATWRAPEGWSLILDYFVSDSDLAMEQQDIGSEAYLAGILVRCYDGSDLGYLEKLIGTNGLDVLFRQICLQAYHGLVITGRAPRERFVEFLAQQLAVLDGQEPGDWDEWLCLTVAELREPSLRPAAEKRMAVCDSRPRDFAIINAADLADIATEDPAKFIGMLLQNEHFDDLPRQIEKWAWFQPVERWPARRPATLPWSPAATFLQPKPDLGRNEPCHCGSGTKYKKCCLDNDQGYTPA